MSIFGFLFLIFLLVILWHVLRVVFRLWMFRRKVQQAYRQAYDRSYAGSSERNRTGRKASGTRRRGKRIPADIGEYVEFEEISFVAETPGPPVKFERQEQISDAEWEEIN